MGASQEREAYCRRDVHNGASVGLDGGVKEVTRRGMANAYLSVPYVSSALGYSRDMIFPGRIASTMACTIEGFLISLMAPQDNPFNARNHSDFPRANGHNGTIC
jgi:hypothetical protein